MTIINSSILQELEDVLENIVSTTTQPILEENSITAKQYLQELKDGLITNTEFQDLMIDLQDELKVTKLADDLELKVELEKAINSLIQFSSQII